jgi:uncharacterized protein
VPNPDQTPNLPAPNPPALEKGSPDFVGLVRFLIAPFLDSPDTLKVDCEQMPTRSKVWIRVAFNEEERGRVFGRGGRNIQAIRTVVVATAKLINWSAHLDVYGEAEHRAKDEHEGNGRPRSSDRGDRRPPRPRGRR